LSINGLKNWRGADSNRVLHSVRIHTILKHRALGLRDARLDPLYVANEGKLIAILPLEFADEMLEKMRSNQFGEHAEIIGEVVAEHAGMVVAKTGIGGTRVVDLQLGEQLPRIC